MSVGRTRSPQTPPTRVVTTRAPTTTTSTTTTSTTTTTTPSTTPDLRRTPSTTSVTARGLALLPAATRDDVPLLGTDAQATLARLVLRHAGEAGTIADIADAIASPTLWCVPMKLADERRVLAAAIAAVALPAVAARSGVPGPDAVVVVDAVTNGTDAVKDAFARLEAARHAGGDVVMAPEWFFVPDSGVAMTRPARDALMQRLAALTAGSDRLLVPGTLPWQDDDGGYHNTAMAFSNGRLLHSVDKRGDGDDVDIATGAGLRFVSTPGHSTFRWRGLSVGLEVCRDHGDARLRYELAEGGKHVVDLHLIVSSGVWLKHAAVGVGGTVARATASTSPSGPRAGRRASSFPGHDGWPALNALRPVASGEDNRHRGRRDAPAVPLPHHRTCGSASGGSVR